MAELQRDDHERDGRDTPADGGWPRSPQDIAKLALIIRAVLVGVGVVWTEVALLIGEFVPRHEWEQGRRALVWRPVEAKVTGVEPVTAVKGAAASRPQGPSRDKPVRPTAEARIRYEFTLHGRTYAGQYHRAKGHGATEFERSPVPGATLTAWYDPADPNTHDLAPFDRPARAAIALATTPFKVVGLWLLAMGLLCGGLRKKLTAVWILCEEHERSGRRGKGRKPYLGLQWPFRAVGAYFVLSFAGAVALFIASMAMPRRHAWALAAGLAAGLPILALAYGWLWHRARSAKALRTEPAGSGADGLLMSSPALDRAGAEAPPAQGRAASAPSMSYSSGTKIVRTDAQTLKALPSVAEHILALVFAAIGLGAFALAVLGDRLPPTDFISPLFRYPLAVFLCLFGAFFLLVAALMWPWQRMTFDARRRALVLERPVRGLGRLVPFKNIEAVEIISDRGAEIAGKLDLVLSDPPGRRLGMVMRGNEGQLQADANQLAEFIGAPARDARRMEAATAAGKIVVSRHFNGTVGAANFRAHKLVEAGSGLLVLKTTAGSQLFRIAFIAGGVLALGFAAGLAALIMTGNYESFWGCIGAVGLCLALGGVFIWAGWKLLANPPVFFDTERGEIRGRKLRVGSRRIEPLPLTAVASVQITSGHVTEDKLGDSSPDSDYTAYEINLVLRDPPGERLTLTAHNDEPHIRADAQRLAEFLDVPLLDHSKEE